MKRPWQVWLLFAVCVLAAGAGMVWLSKQALRADERRRGAESEAELEQRVSLALWRMDTDLAPILAAEVIRPPSEFRSAAKAVDPPRYVLLQFEARHPGFWLSPQMRASQSFEIPKLRELRTAVNLPELIARLPSTPLPTFDEIEKNGVAANLPGASNWDAQKDKDLEFLEANSANVQQKVEQPAQQANAPPQIKGKMTKEADFEQRNKRYQSAAQQSLVNAGARGV